MTSLRRIGSIFLGFQMAWLPGRAEDASTAPEGSETAPSGVVAPDEEDAEWQRNVDRFLETYLPRIEARAANTEGDDEWVYELPELEVEAALDDARVKRALPDAWEVLSDNAKKRLLAKERLTTLETGILNRWILWWGLRPEDYLLQKEERERARVYQARNAQLLKQLEAIRPGLLRGEEE